MASSFYRLDAACGFRIEPAIEYDELIFRTGGGGVLSSLVGHEDGKRIFEVSGQLTNSHGQRVGVGYDAQGEEIIDTPLGGLTRAMYVWRLFQHSKRNGNEPIILRCPLEEIDVECWFVEKRLTYRRVEHQVWNAAILFEQVRTGDLQYDEVTPENPQQI